MRVLLGLVVVVVLVVLALAGCTSRPQEPVPVDSHGHPLLWGPDGYIAEPTPEPEWSIALRRQERIAELRRQLAEDGAPCR